MVAALRAAALEQAVAAQAWDLNRIVSEADRHRQLALSGGYKGVPAANGALEIIGRATGILSDKARNQAPVAITRVVVVLDYGADANGQQRVVESEVRILPDEEPSQTIDVGSDEMATLPTVPDAENRHNETDSNAS